MEKVKKSGAVDGLERELRLGIENRKMIRLLDLDFLVKVRRI